MTLLPLISALALAASLLSATPAFAQAVDADAAQALIKKNDCGKCHAVDKKKDGPSFKETATKLKGKADAEDEIFKHLTTSPKVKIDGKEEEHKAIKSKDEAEVRNLARWILAR
jgi:cytochrome c